MTNTQETPSTTTRATSPRRRSGVPVMLAGAAVALISLAGCSAPAPQGAGDAPATSGPVQGSGDDSSGGPSTSPSPTPTGAAGSGTIAGAAAEWTLIGLSDSTGKVTRPLPAPTLDLRTTGRMNGNGGCNAYGATYSGTADAFRVGSMFITQAGCARGNELETRYVTALAVTTRATVSGARLILSGSGVTLTFQRDDRMSTSGGADHDGVADN